MAVESRKHWFVPTLLFMAVAALYFAIPFALAPAIASCSSSRTARFVMDAYPFLGMHNDSYFRRYYYEFLNDLVRREDKNCPERWRERVYAP